jgi:hypothetical protein
MQLSKPDCVFLAICCFHSEANFIIKRNKKYFIDQAQGSELGEPGIFKKA